MSEMRHIVVKEGLLQSQSVWSGLVVRRYGRFVASGTGSYARRERNNGHACMRQKKKRLGRLKLHRCCQSHCNYLIVYICNPSWLASAMAVSCLFPCSTCLRAAVRKYLHPSCSLSIANTHGDSVFLRPKVVIHDGVVTQSAHRSPLGGLAPHYCTRNYLVPTDGTPAPPDGATGHTMG